MSFLESPRFPDDVALDGMDGGPGYRTTVVPRANGNEQRNIEWAGAKGEWELATGIKTPANFDAVRDLFRLARGRAYGFRLRDWSDYQTDHAHGAITLLSTTKGQLVKLYGAGATQESRTITKPLAGVFVQRWRTGTPSTIGATIDTATGGVTIAGHVSGDTYTWAGEFDVPVRFDTDALRATFGGPARYDDARPLLSWESVPLVEIRVPVASA